MQCLSEFSSSKMPRSRFDWDFENKLENIGYRVEK